MELLNKLIINENQGYALYYKNKNNIITECNGFENINTKKKITSNSNFRLASVSKQFIAYGIMTLIEKGKLTFESKLFDIFADMPLYTKNITIKNLLNHTSGLYDYEDWDEKTNYILNNKQILDEDVLRFIRTTKNTYFEVGTKYQYSNTAYVILGLIIKLVSGKSIGEYLKSNIFDPLQMNNSCVYTTNHIISNRVYGHIMNNGILEVKDQYWCSATIGDGGIYSSINDLIKWLDFLDNNYDRFTSNMFNPNIINGLNTEYGLGIRIKEANGIKVIYHCGETIGTNTIIGFIPNQDIKFIFLTNIDDVNTSVFISNLLEEKK